MSAIEQLAGVAERCAHARRDLAWVKRADLPEVPAEPATPDFYLYGVLGAKNVGKSSLVAAVLGVEHLPEDGRELGEGTRRPRVYASGLLLPRIRDLFARAGVEVDVAPSPGRAAEFEKVAFIDLPDIESRFDEHLETVHRVADKILGLVMVRTAESSFDETFLEKLRAFQRDDRDLFFVMNKFDQWVAARDGDVAAAEAACTDHLAEVLKRLDLDSRRVYFTDVRAAPHREQEGFHLGRLAGDLLRDKSTEELATAKVRTWVHALRYWTLALRKATGLAQGRQQLEAVLARSRRVAEALEARGAVAAASEVLPAHLVEGFSLYLERVLDSDAATERAEGRLIRRVFFHRVDHLPFARVLAAPLYFLGELADGLFHRLPRALAPTPALEGGDENETREMVRGMVDGVNEAFHLSCQHLASHYRDVPADGLLDAAKGEQLLRNTLHQWLRRREDRIAREARPPWLLTRAAMWLPVLFFLLLRPLARAWVLAGRALDGPALAGALPQVALEMSEPGYLLYSVLAMGAVYTVVLCAQYRTALGVVRADVGLEDGRRRQVESIAVELWREVFDRVVPDAFRSLEHALEELESQLAAIEQDLAGLDPDAFRSATSQFEADHARPGVSVTPVARAGGAP